jgi:hypothetical protein
MRGRRGFIILTLYLALLSVAVILLYALYATSLESFGRAAGGQIGRVLFIGVLIVQMFMVVFGSPSATTSAITSERENMTFDLLRTTLISPRALILGKLSSALSYVVLLLLAGIPLQSIAFLFGGVSEIEILLSAVTLIVTSIGFGAVGIYYSAILKKTVAANSFAFAFCGFITAGLPIVVALLLPSLDPYAILGEDTLVIFEAFLIYGGFAMIAINPAATLLITEGLLIEQQFFGVETIMLSNGARLPIVAPWILHVILYAVGTALLLWLAARRVRRIEEV